MPQFVLWFQSIPCVVTMTHKCFSHLEFSPSLIQRDYFPRFFYFLIGYYIKAINFCVLTSYLATLLNSFIVSCFKSLILYVFPCYYVICKFMSSANRFSRFSFSTDSGDPWNIRFHGRNLSYSLINKDSYSNL